MSGDVATHLALDKTERGDTLSFETKYSLLTGGSDREETFTLMLVNHQTHRADLLPVGEQDVCFFFVTILTDFIRPHVKPEAIHEEEYGRGRPHC